MARKKKRSKVDDAPAAPAAPAAVGTSMRDLLRGVTLEPPPRAGEATPAKAPKPKPKPKPKAAPETAASPAGARPSEGLRGADRTAYYDAIAGVRPLSGKAKRAPDPLPQRVPKAIAEPSVDDDVRARLGALVGGGVHFDIAHDGDRVLGRRAGLALRIADALSEKGVVPEASLDLHGMRAADAEREVIAFLRAQQRRGARRVCVVHGKGLNSEAGLGVLRDRVVHVITEGGAAPVVRAFATAHRLHGGTGALIVELIA